MSISQHNIHSAKHRRFPIGKLSVGEGGRAQPTTSILFLRNQFFQPSFGPHVAGQGVHKFLSGFFQVEDARGIAAAIHLQANGHVLRGR